MSRGVTGTSVQILRRLLQSFVFVRGQRAVVQSVRVVPVSHRSRDYSHADVAHRSVQEIVCLITVTGSEGDKTEMVQTQLVPGINNNTITAFLADTYVTALWAKDR